MCWQSLHWSTSEEGKTTVRSLVVRILKNPIILGAIAAIVCLLLGIKIPATVNGVISSMSETCSVMAMITLVHLFNRWE